DGLGERARGRAQLRRGFAERGVDRRLTADRGKDLRLAERVDVEVTDDLDLVRHRPGLEWRGERASTAEATGDDRDEGYEAKEHGRSYVTHGLSLPVVQRPHCRGY